jgi:uncharacterized protein YsxB (DUF464 family)
MEKGDIVYMKTTGHPAYVLEVRPETEEIAVRIKESENSAFELRLFTIGEFELGLDKIRREFSEHVKIQELAELLKEKAVPAVKYDVN